MSDNQNSYANSTCERPSTVDSDNRHLALTIASTLLPATILLALSMCAEWLKLDGTTVAQIAVLAVIFCASLWLKLYLSLPKAKFSATEHRQPEGAK